MQIGNRVRIVANVIVYHHPANKQKPFDIKGMEGTIIDILSEWHGRPISPNLPVVVQFENKFKAHLQQRELEVI